MLAGLWFTLASIQVHPQTMIMLGLMSVVQSVMVITEWKKYTVSEEVPHVGGGLTSSVAASKEA